MLRLAASRDETAIGLAWARESAGSVTTTPLYQNQPHRLYVWLCVCVFVCVCVRVCVGGWVGVWVGAGVVVRARAHMCV